MKNIKIMIICLLACMLLGCSMRQEKANYTDQIKQYSPIVKQDSEIYYISSSEKKLKVEDE